LLLLQSMWVGAGLDDDADEEIPPPASAAGIANAATVSGAKIRHRGCRIASSMERSSQEPDASPPPGTPTPTLSSVAQSSSLYQELQSRYTHW
jgi:hypothetical protein